MKKIITSILLFSFSVVSTDAYQCIKLPILIHHFFDHQNISPEITFVEFIELHYSKNQHHDSHDNQLPYQSDECTIVTNQVMVTDINISSDINLISHPIQYILSNDKIPPTSKNADIWQPPKYL